MSSKYHKSFDPLGEHTEQRAQIQLTQSWVPQFFFLFFFFCPSASISIFSAASDPLIMLCHAYRAHINSPSKLWWMKHLLSCYNSIPLMLHRVKNLNSALTNTVLQQKSFTVINIFSSWVSFHVFLFHAEERGRKIPVTYFTPKTKM